MQFSIQSSQRQELIDITAKVNDTIKKSGVENGLCLIFASHSTAAVILTENETGLINDWLRLINKLVEGEKFEHNQIDNNAEAHLLSGLLGQGKVLPIEEGKLVRGTWQQIFLVELDGPRNRKITVKATGVLG
jgi:secondary thiamine-phosphate synthase enzyme